MGDFFKSRKFKVLIALFIMLIALMLRASWTGGLSPAIEQVAGAVVAPFQKLSSTISDGVSGFFRRYARADEVAQENEALRSEINELLAKLRLLSMGFRHHYIIQVPGFLMPKTSFSLLRLAKAESAQDCLEVVAGTPYAKVLAGVLPAAGQKLDYLKCEHAFQSYFYTTVLAQIDRDLSGRSAADTKRLFRMEAEIYNLDLLFRAKAFFSPQLTPEDLKKLLIPVYGVLSAKNMNALADTRGLDEFLKLYNAGRAGQVYGARSADPADASEVSETRALYRAAQKLLHFSSTPQTVLAALLCLANLERSNIINVIEGVRYGLSPEQISAFLKY